MATKTPATKFTAIAAAREAGLDLAQIERDLAGPEIKATIDESRMLAASLGITGTPSFVIGETVTVGAVGLAKLTEKIAAARR
jgi:protein-disulfide isomerase